MTEPLAERIRKIREHRPLWDLPRGIELAREISREIRAFGYDVGLTGSVLKRGESRKDLDLLVYPLDSTRLDPVNLRAALVACGGVCRADVQRVRAGWRERGSRDEKHVEVWEFGGRRVDLMFVR